MPTTSNFGWTTPADTDLVKDGAAAIRTLGNGIDTSLVDLKGGTTGQVLSKASNTDLDYTWVTTDDANAIQNAIVDAKGDLIAASAADTPARLASSGVNGQVLTVDTTTSTGLKWAAPSTPSFVGAHATKTASQQLSNVTLTAISFDGTDILDTDAFHNPASNNTRMTIPSGKDGKYLITALIGFGSNTTGGRELQIYKNGTTVLQYLTSDTGDGAFNLVISGTYALVAGDYIEIRAYQSSGGNLDVYGSNSGYTNGTSFQLTYLGA